MTNKLRIIAFSLLIVVVAVLATATIVERLMGSSVAATAIYGAWWFVALWAALACTAIAYIVKTRLYRRLFTLMLHLALVLILVGALITRLTARRGNITLTQSTTPTTQVDADGGNDFALPFAMKLNSFNIVNYDGTPTPMDFVSDLTIIDGAKHTQGSVSMNNVLSYHGYRFFQSGFDPEKHSVTLKVQHDPTGITVTYAGYLALFISFILFFFDRSSEFRAVLRKLRERKLWLALIVAIGAAGADAAPRTISSDVAKHIDSLYVLHNGRISPFATLAADFTAKLCGKTSYNGLSATQVLAGWMFYPTDWQQEPMIKVKSAQVRQTLGITGKMACVNDFYTSTFDLKLQPMIDASIRNDESVDSRGLAAVNEQFALINMTMNGNLLKLYPSKHDGTLQWFSPADRLPSWINEDEYVFISKGWGYLNELVQSGNNGEAIVFVSKVRQWQCKQAGDMLPTDVSFNAELAFNRISCTRALAMAVVTIGIIAFIIYIVAMARKRPPARGLNIALTVIVAILWCYLTAIIALRWIAGGHVPLSNGSETMHFMSWAVTTLTPVMCRRMKLILPMGILMAGLTLMVAMMGEANPQVTLLMPVLQSPLLSVHVMVIMVAYSLFAFMMLNGVAALALRRNHEAVTTLALMSRTMLYPAVMLLATGIFIGAVWANVSWGRYWGWDPKEVWALITLLIYCLPLHARSIPALVKASNFHKFAIVAFLAVLITYFGVNFLLGGLHSYA